MQYMCTVLYNFLLYDQFYLKVNWLVIPKICMISRYSITCKNYPSTVIGSCIASHVPISSNIGQSPDGLLKEKFDCKMN